MATAHRLRTRSDKVAECSLDLNLEFCIERWREKLIFKLRPFGTVSYFREETIMVSMDVICRIFNEVCTYKVYRINFLLHKKVAKEYGMTSFLILVTICVTTYLVVSYKMFL